MKITGHFGRQCNIRICYAYIMAEYSDFAYDDHSNFIYMHDDEPLSVWATRLYTYTTEGTYAEDCTRSRWLF